MAGGGGVNYYKRHLGDYAKGWHRFDAMRPEHMPRLPACYAVYLDGQLVYIGQTVDLKNRFYEHKFRFGYGKNIHAPWGSFPDKCVFSVKAKFSGRYGEWAMREIRLIRKLNPSFNSHHKRRILKVAA